MYDVAVIGLGMIGSAALRHLSNAASGLRVLGIGPAEPADWTRHAGAFASHYDQARITRVTDPDRIWATLAQRAIGSYQEIEQRSGIRFHDPVGHLRLASRSSDDTLGPAEAIGRALNVEIERLDQAQLTTQFPYLKTSEHTGGLYEQGGAGCINPRALVAAQLAIAGEQGATMIRAEVRDIVRHTDGFTIGTDTQATVSAKRILLSAHGYTNTLVGPVLKRSLDLVNMAHTTVYAHIDAEQARQLEGMPSVIWPLAGHPVLESVYTTPPTTYPDGRIALKIGGPLWTHPVLSTPEAIREWFQQAGNPIEIAALQEVLLAIMPGLRVLSWSSKPCMNTYTSHGYPYVDQLGEGVFVCTGGCGSAAKSSDEIGRMGALLAQHGSWTYDLPARIFSATYA